jgi:radical SAM protein with 4Fe4S-binding SPASM domain
MKLENSEIFIVSINKKNTKVNNGCYIAYSPLSKFCCDIDDKQLNQLHHIVDPQLVRNTVYDINKEWIKKLCSYELPDSRNYLRQSPQEFTTLSLLPSLTCNFQCKYCYSAQGRSKTTISNEKLKQALDFFIDPERIKPQTIKMFVSGGGEPFLSWENTKFAVCYAQERALKYGFTLWTSIITNGSFVNDDILNVLKKYKCSVCVSFEALKDLQNHLRGHYEKVASTITTYGNAGVPIMLNSTITPLSVNRMNEMTREIVYKYPFVKSYTLEPVTDRAQFDSPESMRSFYRQFGENYRKIKRKYKESKTSIWFSLDEMIDTIKLRYCPGKLCLTPNATFSICHCASSPLEERYEKCVYGEITDKGVVFDNEKFKNLIRINLLHKTKCEDCFAKWNCGGECMTRSDQYPESYLNEVCNFNRDWLKSQLEERLNKTNRTTYIQETNEQFI